MSSSVTTADDKPNQQQQLIADPQSTGTLFRGLGQQRFQTAAEPTLTSDFININRRLSLRSNTNTALRSTEQQTTSSIPIKLSSTLTQSLHASKSTQSSLPSSCPSSALSPNQAVKQHTTSVFKQQPISRLNKSHHSTIYFSDSDDNDDDVNVNAANTNADVDNVIGTTKHNNTTSSTTTNPSRLPRSERFLTASRFQQQHHRRHRQFHRTFTPFDLRTIDGGGGIGGDANADVPPTQTPGAGNSTEESSGSDERGTVRNSHGLGATTTTTAAERSTSLTTATSTSGRLRESPAHLRYRQRAISRSPAKRLRSIGTGAERLADDLVESGGTKKRTSSSSSSASSSASSSPKRGGVILIDKRNMLLNYGPETICVLALVLTTLATFQNASPKIARSVISPPFFPAGSFIHDYPNGQLDFVQSRVKSSDLSLVLFYAPWSADCQHSRRVYEQTAHLHHRNVYFAAVNCWQPGGECRAQYPKIHEWPVAMAYFQTGLAVPYTGRWSTASLLRFVRSLQQPLQRVTDNDGVLRLMMSHDAVVMAFFGDIESDGGRTYETFYTTAIKWLERDPFQSVAFAVVTGAATQHFGVVDTRPLLRVYQWNGTVEHALSDGVTHTKMTTWINAQMIRISSWVQPPGSKAATLAEHFARGPVLVLFTPRNAIGELAAGNDAYDMLRQVGLDYANCASVNQPWIAEMSRVYMSHVRAENRGGHARFVRECERMRDEAEAVRRMEAKCLASLERFDRRRQTTHEKHVVSLVFGNVVNSSARLPSGVRPPCARANVCNAGERVCIADGCDAQQSCVMAAHGEDEAEDAACNAKRTVRTETDGAFVTSMLGANGDEDERSPWNLRRAAVRKRCELHLAGQQLDAFPRVQFFDVAAGETEFERIAEMGCGSSPNRTLSFLAVDSSLFHVFAEQLGVDVLKKVGQTAAVIVDHEFETTFVLEDNVAVSTDSLIDFVHNYTLHKLQRHLRVETETMRDRSVRNQRFELPPTPSAAEYPPRKYRNVELRDIDSQSFASNVLHSNKTVFVLFHSLQCAMCAPMSHSLLLVADLLAELRASVDFVRIDSDRNDLPWHYTVDRLPALIVFPPDASAAESRIYPLGLAATVPNVLAFVLANVERPLRLHGMVLVCNGVRTKHGLPADCARTIRTEIRDDIAFSLRQWRLLPYLRNGIVRRLQMLQRLLLQMQHNDASGSGSVLLDLVQTVRRVWPAMLLPT